MKKIILLITSLLSFNASASVSFNLSYTIGGISGLTDGTSRAILVADTSGNGFSGLTDALTLKDFNFTNGSRVGDDMVLAVMTAQDLGGVSGFAFSTTAFDSTNAVWNGFLAENQKLGIFWFPSGSNNEGETYGFYRSDSIGDFATRAYQTPTNGSTDSIFTLTTELGGSVTPAQIAANNGVIGVPEPSRMVLALVGFAGLMLRRRR